MGSCCSKAEAGEVEAEAGEAEVKAEAKVEGEAEANGKGEAGTKAEAELPEGIGVVMDEAGAMGDCHEAINVSRDFSVVLMESTVVSRFTILFSNLESADW